MVYNPIVIDNHELNFFLNDHYNWFFEECHLKASFSFATYRVAIKFVYDVGLVADAMNHHPIIKIDYKVVYISTTTNCRGGQVTDYDVKLVKKINTIYDELNFE